ncbi:MAG TPA: GNAT family N-acetyltransferase [Candidatus Dormibacteraeota bacterium]
MTEVRLAELADVPIVGQALADAFQRDALTAWFLPDPAARQEEMEAMFARHVPTSIEAGGRLYMTADAQAGALWLPPGSEHENEPPPGSTELVVESFARVNAARPQVPHWYLSFIGSRTPAQGRGSALLKHFQRLADEERVPTALWTANPRNVPFYQRNGYSVLRELDFLDARAWWFWRDADPVG